MTTDRKTLKLRSPSEQAEAPAPLVKKGRGWAIDEKRLDTLHERAREMRRNPTPAQTALAEALAVAESGGFAFKRQAVIGSAIVAFACKPLMMVIELDGDADAALASSRDRSLAEVGYQVVRLPAADILADPTAAAAQVVEAMRARWHERRERRAAAAPRPTRTDHARNR